MKKVLLYIFFLFISATSFAQTDSTKQVGKEAKIGKDTLIVLDSITYHQENRVQITKDTFEVAQSSSAKDGQLKSIGSPEKDSPSQNATSSQIDPGKTTGSIDVSPTGAATYTIPISLSPGIKGVAPQIAITYNSQGGNGVAGYGWNISGLSAITRISSTRFHDNKVGCVNLDADDRFALDGQRLILKSGTYGGDGAEYQTENYSNIKVISIGVSPYGANHGPSSFEIYYPDGTKAFYGGRYDAVTELTYYLSYTENSLGARINYYYDNSENRYINQITYGGNGNAAAINEVNFVYQTSTRKDQVYIAGVSLANYNLLSEINVIGNNVPFRHYSLTYDQISPTNYQRLISIQETSGDESKSFAPITFGYFNNTQNLAKKDLTNLSLSGINQTNCKILTEDFTGDGKIDFIISPNNDKNKVYTFFDHETVYNNTQYGDPVPMAHFDDIFSAKLLSYNDKLFNQQGIVPIANESSTTIKFRTYIGGSAYQPLIYQYEKQWDNMQGNGYYSSCTGDYVDMGSIPKKYLSGDFNGDGLTDIISITKPYQQYYDYEDPNCDGSPQQNKSNLVPIDPGQCCVTSSYTVNSASVQFINLDKRLTSNFVTYSGSLLNSIGTNDQLISADFNGDGKTDIIHIIEGKLTVYGFDENNYLITLLEKVDTRITVNPNLKVLVGDFNGDGKIDLFFPTSITANYNFAQFFSSGKDFAIVEKTMPFRSTNDLYYNGNYTLVQNIPVDFNGDGKTDMINIESYTHNNSDIGDLTIKSYINIGASGSQPGISFVAGPRIPTLPTVSFSGNLKHFPVPVFLTSDKPNFNLEFGIMSDKSLRTFKFGENVGDETLLRSILQDDVVHEITYNSLIPNADTEIPLYQTNPNQTFPYYDIELAPGLKVVSKLERRYNYDQLFQIFGYEGAVGNTEGLGFLGFRKTIRSNWFTLYEENRLYNINITDPQLRGATNKSFTTKYPYLNSNIENTSAANSANDGATINDYITRTDYTYDTSLSPEKIFTNVPTSVMTKDLLNGTNTTVAYTYDNYKNVTKEVTNLSGDGTNTKDITYSNDLGSSYYIGRPLTKKTTATNANDVFTTEEQYIYTGYLPTQIKRKGNGTDWIIENIQYDTFGNTTRKGITAGGVERASTMQYESSGRFMSKSTDVEGLETNFTYDNSTGNLLTQTDPFNLTNTFEYDTWGRVSKKTDYLGKSNYTYYLPAIQNGIEIIDINDDGSTQSVKSDVYGLKISEQSNDVTGQIIEKNYSYDEYGRLGVEYEPHVQGSYVGANIKQYDEYGRVKTLTSQSGKITNITYNGLSVTVNDGTKSVSTTKNALGNTISVIDPGGTINYTYYANGNLKTSNFDGNEQSIIQDGWGRKTQLTDPSAGVYNYTYNAFGESLTESTPKGVTTYVYDAIGKLQSKNIVGTNNPTNMAYQYTYDATSKLLTSMTLANTDGNNANYTYTYDTYKRLQSTVENNTYATFTKSFTFDGFGRINTETSIALNKNNSKTVTKTLLNSYQYGALNSISDNVTGEVIWMVNSVNSRGQVTMASLANGNMRQTNTYDQYGFATEMKTDRLINNPDLLMSLGYNFNSIRGLLYSRSNSMFGGINGWNESFEYDNQDRLIKFGITGTSLNQQDYDNKGRITNNSYLGNYVYNGGAYQQTGLNNVTVDAQRHYQDRVRQDITYNAFKSPVEISEAGKEKISFQYNASMGRSHRYYGDENADKMQRRFRKHYSEDGSMEITEDIQLGTTSFVFYMGGDAYGAPAIWKEISDASNQITKNMYYLHRDHLGSILLITDNQGTAVEQRQFDAWGNIVKLTDGNGNALTDFVILDRGYTGHEHMLGVGLINMNARLYDPLLHRFFSPDNYVQDPTNTQNFNRYGYVLNNPLSHVDPSGEFIPLLAIAIGAFIGAASGGAAYIGSAIRTGNWNWGQFGLSVLGGAVIGGITGGLNPWSVVGQSFGGAVATGFASGILPSIGGQIGDFNFSISPAIAFGNSFGVGANLSVGVKAGKWSFSAGLGFMAYSNYQGFGKSGTEIRESIMAAYDNGTNGISVGTNNWQGFGGMSTFNQRTGSIGLHFGNFKALYENDGGSGVREAHLGNKGDSYRTAALNLSWGDYSVGLNLFTGKRINVDDKHSVINCVDEFGRKYKRGFVDEINTPYRLGLLTAGYKNYRFGVNSEHIRHTIQDRVIHGMIGDAGFQNISWNWLPYMQYKSINSFSSW